MHGQIRCRKSCSARVWDTGCCLSESLLCMPSACTYETTKRLALGKLHPHSLPSLQPTLGAPEYHGAPWDQSRRNHSLAL